MIKINGKNIDKIYLGSQPIAKVYRGTELIWPSGEDKPNTPTGIQLSEYTVGPEYTYILDDYPGAFMGVSLKKLTSASVQGLMLERDDGALMDVRLYEDPAKSIDLDSLISGGSSGTLGEWVGSSSAYVRLWYDQTGNGNHLEQTDDLYQCRFINAGVIDIENNMSAIRNVRDNGWMFNGFLAPTGDAFIGQSFCIYKNDVMASSDGEDNTGYSIIPHTPFADRRAIGITKESPDSTAIRLNGGYTVFEGGGTSQVLNSIKKLGTGSSFSMRENGIQKSISDTGVQSLALQSDSGLAIFKKYSLSAYNTVTTGSMQGTVQELIWYFSDQTANEVAIESDRMDKYNI